MYLSCCPLHKTDRKLGVNLMRSLGFLIQLISFSQFSHAFKKIKKKFFFLNFHIKIVFCCQLEESLLADRTDQTQTPNILPPSVRLQYEFGWVNALLFCLEGNSLLSPLWSDIPGQGAYNYLESFKTPTEIADKPRKWSKSLALHFLEA